MQLLQLDIANVGLHRRRTLEFHQRLTGIVGPNGSGKSTVLAAVYAALTNDFSRTHGTKQDNVSQLAPADERSEISLTFEHAGVTACVTRTLRPENAQSVLTINGEVVRGDRAINTKILEILGVPGQILAQYAIVEQGEMFAPLAVGPTDRAKAFQKLFGIDQAEKAWKAAGDWIGAQGPLTVPDEAPLRTALETEQANLATTEQEIERLLTIYNFASGRVEDHPAHAVLLTYQRKRGEITERDTLRRRREDTQAAVTRNTTDLTDVDADLAAVEQALQLKKAEYDQVREDRVRLESYQQEMARLARTRSQLDKLRQQQAALVPPTPPEDLVHGEEFQAVQAELVRVGDVCRTYRNMLKTFDTQGQAECPTCGTTVESLGSVLDEARQQLPGLEARHQELRTRIDRIRDYHGRLRTYELQQQTFETQIEQFQSALGEEPPRPTVLTFEQIDEKVAEYETLQDGKRELETERRTYDGTLRQLTGQLTELTTQIDRLSQSIAATLVTEEDATAATAEIEELRRLASQYSQLVGCRTVLQQMINRLEGQIQAAREAAQRARRMTGLIDRLQQSRSVLHRDRLPRAVSHSYLALMTEEINRVLDVFEAGFHVHPEEGLSFTAHFFDGRVQSMLRLSGGQKVVLAWAFRIAVNATFAADLGLICLDEPTEFLDEHNVERVGRALERLKRLSDSRGLQVIMVTHERGLSSLFDRVERLTND